MLTSLLITNELLITFRGAFERCQHRMGTTSNSSDEGPIEKIDSSKNLVKSNEVSVIELTKGPKVSSAALRVEFAILRVFQRQQWLWSMSRRHLRFTSRPKSKLQPDFQQSEFKRCDNADNDFELPSRYNSVPIRSMLYFEDGCLRGDLSVPRGPHFRSFRMRKCHFGAEHRVPNSQMTCFSQIILFST